MKKQVVNWTQEQDEYIKKSFKAKYDREIGLELGKTESQIRARRIELGLKKQRQTCHKNVPEGMKWCWYCNKFHPLEYFNKNKNKPDGLQDECKIAVKQIALKRKTQKLKDKEEKNNIKEKQCEKCGQIKPIYDFVKNASTKDGYSNLCRECLNKNLNKKFKLMEDDNMKECKIINGVKYKQCTKCKEFFPETEEYFYKDKNKKGEYILRPWCKSCFGKASKKYSNNMYKKDKIGTNKAQMSIIEKVTTQIKNVSNTNNDLTYIEFLTLKDTLCKLEDINFQLFLEANNEVKKEIINILDNYISKFDNIKKDIKERI